MCFWRATYFSKRVVSPGCSWFIDIPVTPRSADTPIIDSWKMPLSRNRLGFYSAIWQWHLIRSPITATSRLPWGMQVFLLRRLSRTDIILASSQCPSVVHPHFLRHLHNDCMHLPMDEALPPYTYVLDAIVFQSHWFMGHPVVVITTRFARSHLVSPDTDLFLQCQPGFNCVCV